MAIHYVTPNYQVSIQLVSSASEELMLIGLGAAASSGFHSISFLSE